MVSGAAVVDRAKAWVGTTERTGNNDVVFADHYGITGQSWCFAFTDYVFEELGAPLPGTFMYVPYGVTYARNSGQAVEIEDQPLPGDIVFFTWGDGWGRWTPGTGDHVGIVERSDGDTLYTIEGNVSPEGGGPQGVWPRRRSISGTVICYWRPTVLDGSLGVAELIQEEDMTPEQDALVKEIRNLVGGAFDQTVAANARLDDIRNYVGGAYEQAVAVNTRLDQLAPNVEAIGKAIRALPTDGPKPPTLPPIKVVDVEASLKQATPAQLFAAVSEYLAKPNQPAADADA